MCESAWAAAGPNRAGNGCMLNAILAAWNTVTFHSPSQYRAASPAWKTAVPPPGSTSAFIRPSVASWWMKLRTLTASASFSTIFLPLSASTWPPAWLYRL